MAGPAEEFAHAALGVHAAEPSHEGDFIHRYQAKIAAVDGVVRILTPAPERNSDTLHSAFREVSGQWHNPSTHPNVVSIMTAEPTLVHGLLLNA